jgi:hypothetical protein
MITLLMSIDKQYFKNKIMLQAYLSLSAVLSRGELLGQRACNTDNNPADGSGYGLKYAKTTKITRSTYHIAF